MQFRATNRWVGGGLNQSSIKDFYAACGEDTTRTTPFVLDADEPAIMAGGDSVPNPVEFVLHALISCLTTSAVYHAAVAGIEIEAIESELAGDMDARGLFGLSDDVHKGYDNVQVIMRVKTDATAETIRGLALYSPVFEMISGSLPVDLTVEKL